MAGRGMEATSPALASRSPARTIAPAGAGEATPGRFGGMGTTLGPRPTRTIMTTVTPIPVPLSFTRGLCLAPRLKPNFARERRRVLGDPFPLDMRACSV